MGTELKADVSTVRHKYQYVTAIMFMSLLFLSCSNNPLIGYWELKKRPETIFGLACPLNAEFLKDGTLIMTIFFGIAQSGRYRMIDEGRIEVTGFEGEAGVVFNSSVFKYRITDDTLNLDMAFIACDFTKKVKP
jgi:hypothetical protein